MRFSLDYIGITVRLDGGEIVHGEGMKTDAIRNVSGTAFWIAHQRAHETQRQAPLFRDPWAAELAGERGAQVQKQLGWFGSFSTWANVARTAILDQRVLERVGHYGVDTVLNLGAGLDTRAFRLELPARLRWFDVDLPEILEHKSRVLKGAAARCQYEAIAADLSDGEIRRSTLERVARGARRVLVITEGVLEYLSAEEVRSLALGLHELAACHFWLLTLMSPNAFRRMKTASARLARFNAPLRFAPEEGTEFFSTCGWQEAEWVSILKESMRLGCLPRWLRPPVALLDVLGSARNERYYREAGVACLARAQ